MSNYADDIRRIAKQGGNKGGLKSATNRAGIPGDSEATFALEDADSTGITPPLTLDILTYAATPTEIQANNGNFNIYQAATARITDADGKVFDIDTINFTTP